MKVVRWNAFLYACATLHECLARLELSGTIECSLCSGCVCVRLVFDAIARNRYFRRVKRGVWA